MSPEIRSPQDSRLKTMNKLFLAISLFILPALTLAQSTSTTIADGNWTDSAIWNSGVPGENDTAIIEHTVAVDDDVPVMNVTISASGTLNFPTGNTEVEVSDGGSFEVLGTIDSDYSLLKFYGDGELLGNPSVWGVQIAGGVVLSGSTITESLILLEGGYLAETPGGDPITDESLIPNYTNSTELDFEGEHSINGPEKGWGSGENKNPKSILINVGADVTLNTPRTLDGLLNVFLGQLTTNGNLTVTPNGNLFIIGTVTGDITITRSITQNEGFRLLSSPVDVDMSDLLAPIWTQGFATGANTSSGNKNIWQWDNNSADASATNWSELPEISSTLEQLNGVLIYIFQDDDATNSDPGSFPKELSVTGPFPGEPDDPDLNPNIGGFTLIGNPWVGPMEVDLDKSSGISNILYIYDPNHTESSGDWLTFDMDAETGDWEDGIIAPMQSFFIETTAADPEISIAQTETYGAEFFGKSGEIANLLQLSLEGEGLKSTTWLRFSESGLMSFDNSDARKLTPLSANYAILATESEEGILLNMNHLPLLEEPISLPLITDATKSGEFTIKALQHELPKDWIVELKDHHTGQISTLDEHFSYSFSMANQAKAITDPLKILQRESVQHNKKGVQRFELIISSNISTGISGNQDLPGSVELNQNYPNPFNPVTVIGYELPVSSEVQLEVYDMLGRRVATLVNNQVEAGWHEIQFDASNLASGVYIYRLQAGNQLMTKKLTLIK